MAWGNEKNGTHFGWASVGFECFFAKHFDTRQGVLDVVHAKRVL